MVLPRVKSRLRLIWSCRSRVCCPGGAVPLQLSPAAAGGQVWSLPAP